MKQSVSDPPPRFPGADGIHVRIRPRSPETGREGGTRTSGYPVTYVLEGMVFSGPPTASGDTSGDMSLAAGGTAGSKMAVFRLDSDGSVAAADDIEITATFAISMEGSGDITRTVLNRSLEGIPGVDSTETHEAKGIIKAAPALSEVVTPGAGAEAKAATGFMNFGVGDDGSPVLRASLGSIVFGVADPNLRNAQDTDDIDTLSDIVQAAVALGAEGYPTNAVTFMGDFSFAKTVAVNVDCMAETLTEIRKMDESDPPMPTNEFNAQEALSFVADTDTGTDGDQPLRLCIEVDGMTEIPETPANNPFQVMATYKGLINQGGVDGANAAHPPMGMARDLASIGRDGASFNIPYLTVNEHYNQRVILVNRGAEAKYTFGNFQAAGDGMASAGPHGDRPASHRSDSAEVDRHRGRRWRKRGVGDSLGRDRPGQYQCSDSAAALDGRHGRHGLSGLASL